MKNAVLTSLAIGAALTIGERATNSFLNSDFFSDFIAGFSPFQNTVQAPASPPVPVPATQPVKLSPKKPEHGYRQKDKYGSVDATYWQPTTPYDPSTPLVFLEPSATISHGCFEKDGTKLNQYEDGRGQCVNISTLDSPMVFNSVREEIKPNGELVRYFALKDNTACLALSGSKAVLYKKLPGHRAGHCLDDDLDDALETEHLSRVPQGAVTQYVPNR